MENVPPVPENSFRIILKQISSGDRLDSALMKALRDQDEDPTFKTITRAQFKDLFHQKKVLIKGQPAKPASTLSSGTTYIDILR